MQKNKFYFSSGPYQQTLQGLYDALSLPEAFVKLMGPAQSGKTSLCEKLTLYMRRKEYKVVHFDYAIESPEMLRTMLARELDLPNLTNFARVLEDALVEDEKPLVLIFDDAHLLTDITLIEVYRLAEVQVGTKRMLNIVLCGEPSLDQRLLNNSDLKSLLLHVSHKFYLDAMDAETLNMFFLNYLEKAGMIGLQLEPAAMNYFYKTCKGYPEPAVSLCRLIVESRVGDNELLPVTKEELIQLVKGASAEQNLPSSGFLDNNQKIIVAPVLAVIGIASLGFLYQLVTSESGVSNDTELAMQQENAALEIFETEDQLEGANTSGNDNALATDPETPNSANPAQVSTTVTVTAEAVDGNFPEDQEPVSDSALSLVTAAERGVAAEDIVEPQYEALAALNENIDAAVQLTPLQQRRVLTLEDNESEETAISLVPNEGVADESQSIPSPQAESQTQDAALEDDLVAFEDLEAGNESSNPEGAELALNEENSDSLTNEELMNDFESLDSLEDGHETDSIASGSEEALRAESEQTPESPVTNNLAGFELAEIESASLLANSSEETTDELSVVQAIEADVARWVSAWQSQSLPEYFSHYHENFAPRYQNSISEWQANRRRVIGNAAWIRLDMSDFELIAEDNGVYEVHFWLAYESPTYSDNTLKKLMVTQVEGSWQILEEINLQVES